MGGQAVGGNPEPNNPRMCLTLHQPLASLMAYGLKRVEGRGWTSTYTGPLWIHAASKEASPEDIRGFEEFYTRVFQEETLSSAVPLFPAHYPTSVLVGRVRVAAVVHADDFAGCAGMPSSARLEGEANGSDYFFLCEAAERLVMPFQMGGEHKLWLLDKKVVQAAERGLRACDQMPIQFLHHMRAAASTVGGPTAIAGAAAPVAIRPPRDRGASLDTAAADAEGEEEVLETDQAALLEQLMISEAIALSLAETPRTVSLGGATEPPSSSSQGQDVAVPQAYGAAQDSNKRIRNLQKKLRQIEDLEKKVAAGVQLESNQLDKVAQKSDLELELARLVSTLHQ